MNKKQLCVIAIAVLSLLTSTIIVGNSNVKSKTERIYPTITATMTSYIEYNKNDEVSTNVIEEETSEVETEECLEEEVSSNEQVEIDDTIMHHLDSWTDEEFDMLCKIAYTEYGTCGDMYAYYLVCCVAVNRVGTAFGATLYDVMVAPNQYLGDGYWTWDWSTKNYRDDIIERAVFLALTQNTIDKGIVYSDSLHRYYDSGYAFSYLGQDYYYGN